MTKNVVAVAASASTAERDVGPKNLGDNSAIGRGMSIGSVCCVVLESGSDRTDENNRKP